jgi:hypothetical protein
MRNYGVLPFNGDDGHRRIFAVLQCVNQQIQDLSYVRDSNNDRHLSKS